jgi:hypothetical protein
MVAGEGLTRYPPLQEARYSRFGAQFGRLSASAPCAGKARQHPSQARVTAYQRRAAEVHLSRPFKTRDTDPARDEDLTLLNGSEEAKTKSDPRTA